MKIAIITPGILPVPAVDGGAVESLIQELISENNNDDSLDITVFGLLSQRAESSALKHFKNVHFEMFSSGVVTRTMDKFVYSGIKLLKPRANVISYRYIFERLSIIRQYRKSLRHSDFDRIILVTNSTLFLIFRDPIVRDMYLSRTIFYLHNEVQSMYGFQKSLGSLSSVWGISQFVLDAFDKKFPDAKAVPHSIIRNSVDAKIFRPSTNDEKQNFRIKYQLKSTDFVIVFSGRLVREKGAQELLQAIQQVVIPHLKILIVGATFYSSDVSTGYMKEMQKLANCASAGVIFTGYVPYKQMPVIYDIADIVCLPSMWDEPAGMTMLEAATMGKPLITTKSGGIPEYLSSKYVFMVNRENAVTEIADNITYIHKNLRVVKCNSQLYAETLRSIYSKRNYYLRFSELLNESR